MTFDFQPPLKVNLTVFMNRLGYHAQRRTDRGEQSYVRRLRSGSYPRFHLYVTVSDTRIRFKLHLDEKQPSYRGHTAHSGQYDGPLVAGEAERIKTNYLKYHS